MKYWISAAVVMALAASLILNGEAITVSIVVNLAIWGLLGIAFWHIGKFVLGRCQRRCNGQ